jgi:TonB family protein
VLASVLVMSLSALPAAQARADSPAEGAEGASAAAAEPAVVAVAARPISEKQPKFPDSARKAGREGWVIVSYVVGKDGWVTDVVVEDASGPPELAAAATAAVARWRYEPATLNGEPTEESHAGVLFPFAVGTSRSSRSFVKKYRRVMSTREKGDLEEAEQMTRELAADPELDLPEVASTEILLSLLSRDRDDERGELRHLERAHVGQGAYIDDAAEESLLFRMFALQVELSDYAEALSTYDALVEARGRKRMPEAVEKVAGEIRELSENGRDFGVAAVLGEADPAFGGRGRFDHLLLRRLVGFVSDSLEDDVDEYDLRCDFHRVKGKPRVNRAIRIPETWGNCRVYVYGDPGSEFRLVEYADPSS